MANLRIKYKRARRECVRLGKMLNRMLNIAADTEYQGEVVRLDARREVEAARREADKLGFALADADRELRAAQLENGRLHRILDGMRRHPVGRLVYAAIERKGGFWDGEG